MTKTIRIVLLVLVVAFFNTAIAQTKMTTSLKPVPTQELSFFEIQKSFNDYWGPKNVENGYFVENGIKKKAFGWKQFKRWEYYWSTRIDPTTGAFPNKRASDFYVKRGNTSGDRNATGNWTSMGPTSATGGYHGLGRLNCVAFRSGDNNTFYVGSPSGGLWKTTDGGTNWTVLTDDNDVLGVSDAIVIAGASTSSDTVYIATGDRDGGSMWSLGGGQWHDNNSIGVLKSTDGGTTWSSTGLTFTTSQKETINRMLLDPNDNNIIYAATSNGLYKTTDAGTSWTNIYSIEFVDIEFNPGNSQTIYGSTRNGKIYLSTNGGSSWTNSLDLSGSNAERIDIAVSANETGWVFAVVVASDDGLYAVYKSEDNGLTYGNIYNGSNLLASDCSGSNSGGQGNYDLAIAVDPTNANNLFIGGVNTWHSSDAGLNWSISNMWSGTCTGAAVEVHADKHFMAYQNGTSTLFECNDGGLYKTTDAGSNWSHIGNGLEISQLYRLGVSQTSSSDVIAGLQDNGTKSRLSGNWNDVIGGDGMDCMIDYTDVNTQYGESQYGGLERTTNYWLSSTDITAGLTGSPWWVMPIAMDPSVNTTIYTATNDVFKSTNQGTNWTKISSWGGSYLKELTIAPSNSNYIYTTTQSILYRTTDGGTNWSNITGTLPVGSSSITYISVKEDDPNTVWVSMGQYNSYGVYETTDGGTTWTNISTGLPSIPVMCVIQNKLNTTETELYAGTDVGVYVKVGNNNWSLFSDGLPNVVINELKIFYNSSTPALSRIRAATSGRGMWESELYSVSTSAPVSDFEANDTTPGVNSVVLFTDRTVNTPTSWQWSFSPSTVRYKNNTSSNSQNPQLEFLETGSYEVSLLTSNANGNDTETKAGYITVGDAPGNYAEAYSTNPFGYISRVQIGTIDKSSTYTNIGDPDPDDRYYEDWTAYSTNVVPGQDFSITITCGSTNADLDLGIWVDTNRDGDFEDDGENLVCAVDGGGEGTFTMSIPTNADVGATRMRIRIDYYGSSCNNFTGSALNGEVEDYTLNIQAATTTWIGTTSNWNDTSNWPNEIVPNSSYQVTIPASPSGGNMPIIQSSTNAKCYNLTLETGATITVNGNLDIEK